MKIYEFSNPKEQALALSQSITRQINSLLKQKPQVTLAVSGGKSPIGLFQELSQSPIEWERVTITLVDERFIATDHPDSNENLVRQHLLVNHAEKAHFISLVTTRNILTSVSNANLQVAQIDLAVLGMGEDGHTASIFPDCPELSRAIDVKLTPERYVITTPAAANYQRIGLSLAGILEIPHLYLSISGAKKREVLSQAASGITPNLPLSYVLHERNNLEIFFAC
jgi:6-phosphogluconolactonase